MRIILKGKIITHIGIIENKINANWKDRNERLKPTIMQLSALELNICGSVHHA